MTLGERLTRLRTLRKWDMQELAERAGVPYMTIYRLETGLTSDTTTAIGAKLAKALGVPLDVLAGTYETVLAGPHGVRDINVATKERTDVNHSYHS